MENKIGKKIRNLPMFSGTALKIIATAAMTVQHFCKIVLNYLTGAVWFPMWQKGLLSNAEYFRIDDFIRFTLYDVGDIAYPLFALLVSEGYRHTKDRKKYMERMLLFALISEIPFDLGFFSTFSTRAGTFPFYWEYQNVLFTYFFALVCLYCIDKIKERFAEKGKILPTVFAALCLIAASCIAELLQCDYGAYGVIMVVLFYWLRDRRAFQAGAFLLAYTLIENEVPNIFIVSAALMILLYNGKKGKAINKYFFYIFYPAHIMIFYLITLALGVLI